MTQTILDLVNFFGISQKAELDAVQSKAILKKVKKKKGKNRGDIVDENGFNSAAFTESVIHSENHEVSLQKEWAISNLSNTSQPVDWRPRRAETGTKKQTEGGQSKDGISFAISEYVSVNQEAKSLRSLSTLALKYLHKRRLKERGYRMSSKKLGEGGFGAVYKVYLNGDRSKPLACKIMVLSKDKAKSKNGPSSMLQTFSNEVFVMETCRHENIVSIRQHFIYSHGRSAEDIRMMHSYILMDYATLGTLYAKLKKFGPFDESTSRGYFAQTANALEHLHLRGIAHRDLKLGNILLTSEGDREVLKLTDFGLSRQVNTKQSGHIRYAKPAGTMSYMAPELVNCYVMYNSGQKKDIIAFDCFGVDLWALGVCLYMLLAKVHPFDSPPSDKAERIEFAKQMLTKQLAEEWQLPETVKTEISWSCLQLLTGLMEGNVQLRLNIYQVKAHPWLTKADDSIF